MSRAHSGRPATVYLSRRFAIDAGRELAKHDRADLLVHDDAGRVDFRISYSKGPSRWRWNQPRRSASPGGDRRVVQPAMPTDALVDVVLPYDSWCIRTARKESAQALTGLCAPDVLDELLSVITELVLQSTVQSRSECTLTVRRIDDEVLIVVRERQSRPTTQRRDVGALGSGMGAMHSMTTEYGAELAIGEQCIWARFNLLGSTSNPA